MSSPFTDCLKSVRQLPTHIRMVEMDLKMIIKIVLAIFLPVGDIFGRKD